MPLTPEQVARLAELARIDLTPEEVAHFAPQLDVILDAVASVAEVAQADVPPTSHPLPLVNVFRDDRVEPSLPVGLVLANAPATDGDTFQVPRILGEA